MNKTKILEIEKWNTMIIYDTKVYVKMDLLYRREDEKIVIVDWKTGKEDDFSDQLHLYALYASDHYAVPLEAIELRVEYLLTGDCETYIFNEEDISVSRNKVKYYIDEMKSCLADAYYNRPKDISFFTPMPSRKVCRDCNLSTKKYLSPVITYP